jgi:hypothetical protein
MFLKKTLLAFFKICTVNLWSRDIDFTCQMSNRPTSRRPRYNYTHSSGKKFNASLFLAQLKHISTKRLR